MHGINFRKLRIVDEIGGTMLKMVRRGEVEILTNNLPESVLCVALQLVEGPCDQGRR